MLFESLAKEIVEPVEAKKSKIKTAHFFVRESISPPARRKYGK
jgi:hypothetical protein